MAGQRAQTEAGQARGRRASRWSLSTSNVTRPSSLRRSWTPARSPEPDGCAVDLGRDRGPGQVAHLVERPALHGAAAADDRDPVAELLDLGEDVAREQHGAAVGLALRAGAPGRPPPSAGRGRRSARRAAAARRRRRARRRARPSGGCPSSSCAPSCADRGRSVRARCAPLRRSNPPRRPPSRSMTSPPVRLGHRLMSPGTYASRRCRSTASRHGSPPSSATEPASWRSRPSRIAHGDGLARAVRSEEPVDLAGGDLEVETVECRGRTEGLHQPRTRDRGGHTIDGTEAPMRRLRPLVPTRSSHERHARSISPLSVHRGHARRRVPLRDVQIAARHADPVRRDG